MPLAFLQGGMQPPEIGVGNGRFQSRNRARWLRVQPLDRNLAHPVGTGPEDGDEMVDLFGRIDSNRDLLGKRCDEVKFVGKD